MNSVATIGLAAAVGFLAPDGDGVWQLWVKGDGAAPVIVAPSESDSVWVSDPSADGKLLVTRADGSAVLLERDLREVRSIRLGKGCDHASLSPDGTRIVYACPAAGGRARRDIAVLDLAAGAGPRFLRSPGLQHDPVWSADGRSILFSGQERDGSGESIWMRSVDGTSEQQLSVGRHLDLEPVSGNGGSIYFSSNRDGDYDIYRMNPGSFSVSRVVDSKGHDGSPRLSRDGQTMLFVSDRGGRPEIWEAAADGTAARKLDIDHVSVRSPMFVGETKSLKPRPGSIAYLRAGRDGRWQPWAMRTDGSRNRQVADLAKDPSRISVSRDGQTLLANSSDGTVYLIDMRSRRVEELTIEPAGSTDAALSPDGRQIAFSVSTLGGIDTNDIWVVPIEGGKARKITEQNYMQHFPTWGPNGEILYLSGRGGQVHDIWSVRSRGGTPREVLGNHRYNFELTISPAGDLAFSSNEGGNYDLYWMASGSKTAKHLTQHAAYDGQSSFSPDGTQLVFVSRRNGAGHLWILDMESKATIQLTKDGEYRMPVWYADDDAATTTVTEARR